MGVLFLFLVPACNLSTRVCHRSPLSILYASCDAEDRSLEAITRHAPWIEDLIVRMADEFDVPLREVIPVEIYCRSEEGQSYYNRITRAIVLRGPLDTSVLVHELSHLFAHQVLGSPPYWSDQGLAEYMEMRFAGTARPLEWSGGTAEPRKGYRLLPEKAEHLVHHIARTRDSSEVLAHLTRDAVDEERGWGMLVVSYLFEDRWGGQPMGERIRQLFSLSREEIAEIAPSVIQFCRQQEILGTSQPQAVH